MFNKELENIKTNQTELMSTVTEIKNTLEGINSRLVDTEEQISKLEDRVMKITQDEQKKEKKRVIKNQVSLRDLWDNIEHTNIHIIGVPEGEEREKGAENIFEDIVAGNFPNLGEETHPGPRSTENPR